jgi:hypothetical protein
LHWRKLMLLLCAALAMAPLIAMRTPAAPAGGQPAAPAEIAVAQPAPIIPPALAEFKQPADITASDLPNDNGSSILITWRKSPSETEDIRYTIYFAEGESGAYEPLPFDFRPIGMDESLASDNLQYFPFKRDFKQVNYAIIDFTAFDTAAQQAFDNATRENERLIAAGLQSGPAPVLRVYDHGALHFKLGVVSNGAVRLFDPVLFAQPRDNWFDWSKFNNLVMSLALLVLILFFIETARKRHFFIRRIAGLDAVDEAIGRATEMGRPIFYLCGLDPMTTVSTIAATNLLGHVAKHVANYESQVKVPCFDPIVMSVCQETVREAYFEAGRPESYNPDTIFFLTNDQFSYVTAVNGMMVRERPAANFFFGYYYAESLLLGEVGQSTGAIQIAGTDSNVQIPFFITSCDYVLIGEELYAASAYISREPKLLGSIKASDMAKAVIIIVLFLGLVFSAALLIGAKSNSESPLGVAGEKMEYFLQVFNQHS